MGGKFRVIDTGVRDGRWQIAFDQALIDLHGSGQIPDTIRFMRFPPTVLIGRHQAVAHEVHLDYCRKHKIGLVRRVTGGGAIYLDEGQVGWELVLRRENLPMSTLGAYAAAICEAVAAGLSEAFDISARFRPRNDIEVDGRKLSGTGGFFDGASLIYQGTVLVDMDAERMAGALNLPQAKLAKRALDRAAARVITLKDLLGEAPRVETVHEAVLGGLARGLGIEPQPGEVSAAELAAAQIVHDEEIGTDEFVFQIDAPGAAEVYEGHVTGAGGTVSAYVRLEGAGGARIREVLFTGDFFITPPRIVHDLEASLRGIGISQAGDAITAFLETAHVDMLSIAPGDFRAALTRALAAAISPQADASSQKRP